MPGPAAVPGQPPVKEPGVGGRAALVGLQPAPALGHPVYDGRHNVLAGGTHQVGDRQLVAPPGGRHPLPGDQPPVDHRGGAHPAPVGGLLLLPGRKQGLRRQGAECGQVGAAGPAHHRLPERIVVRRGGGGKLLAHPAAAAHHRAGRQPPGQRRQAELLHAHGAGALAHQGHPVGVAAKGRDVVMHPLQGAQLVVQAVVAGVAGLGRKLGQAGEAQRPQAVVDGHRHHPFGGPGRPVKVLFVAAAADVLAAVDVEQHRQPGVRAGVRGGPDVQKQAVFAVVVVFAAPELVVIERLLRHLRLVVKAAGLVAGGAVGRGLVGALPAGDGGGVLPPAGGGVADALVGGDARPLAAAAGDRAAGGVAGRVHGHTFFLPALGIQGLAAATASL